MVQFLQRSLGRAVQQLRLQFLQRFTHALQQREEMIGHRVEQRVGEMIRAAAADLLVAAKDAMAHRLEHVLIRLLLDRDEDILAEKHADLLRADLAGFVVDVHHLRHDEEMPGVIVDLWPLVGVEDVLHRQRMHMKMIGHALEHRHVAQPADVHPAHQIVVTTIENLVDFPDLLRPFRVPVVFDQLDDRLDVVRRGKRRVVRIRVMSARQGGGGLHKKRNKEEGTGRNYNDIEMRVAGVLAVLFLPPCSLFLYFAFQRAASMHEMIWTIHPSVPKESSQTAPASTN